MNHGRASRSAAVIATFGLAVVGVSALALSQLFGPGGATTVVTADSTMEPSVGPKPRVSDTPPGSAEPVLDKILTIQDSRHVPMPLDPYLTPMEGIRLIDQARDVAVARCMRSLGFKDWTPDTIRTWRAEDYREHDLFEYLDPEDSTRSGYPRAAETAGRSETAESAPRHEPTVEERQAYEGSVARTASGRSVPQGGCAVVGDAEIRKDTRDLPADPRSLAVSSRSSALGDSRVRAAIGAWRSCMQRSGVTGYDHPVPAMNDPRWQSRAADEPASADEKRVAGADATCRTETNLVGIYKTVRSAYEQRLLERHKDKIEESREIFDVWVDNARRVIATGVED
ncbi:hypothetical protein AB0K60_04320 [Thermopolyspora sp. NPDC052614]|uniref:hypothetical protein n=1 Tax=Thermopolyspora sp. NPDC052614 TaxID=3155682 RepID=UPI0034479E16